MVVENNCGYCDAPSFELSYVQETYPCTMCQKEYGLPPVMPVERPCIECGDILYVEPQDRLPICWDCDEEDIYTAADRRICSF